MYENLNERMTRANVFTQTIAEIMLTKPAGSWRTDRRFKNDCYEVLELAETLRVHDDARIAMYGFRVQMLISEFVETDTLYHEKIVHLREVRNQEELLQLALHRATEAFEHILMNKEAEHVLRKSI